MTPSSFRSFSFLLLISALHLHAQSLADYQEKLRKKFTLTRSSAKVKISACPRLLELAFVDHVARADAKKQTRLAIWNAWLPQQRALLADGYAFEIEFFLLDQNLDSGIEIDLSRDLRPLIRLENNKGEYALMYKLTGDRVSKLDFSSPQKNFTAFFNTRTEQGTPLIRPGIESVSLRIGPIGPHIPETILTWAVPLWYGDIPRPHELKSRFGDRPIPSLVPYKSNIYHRVEFAPSSTKPSRPLTFTPPYQ
ncbi:MAG: hypothetical protein N2595_08125 [bacterium]|nr:hypothetical protein [bacterium]